MVICRTKSGRARKVKGFPLVAPLLTGRIVIAVYARSVAGLISCPSLATVRPAQRAVRFHSKDKTP
ncbi:MAG: hypothetical protein JJU24_14980 [Natronohydrobacter sp.]|nr:hypothetical protein [Natronohydrobacter sp.]